MWNQNQNNQPEWLIRDNMLYQELNPDPVEKARDDNFEKFIKDLENGN